MFFLITNLSYGQSELEHCATDEANQIAIQNNPNLQLIQNNIETFIQDWINENTDTTTFQILSSEGELEVTIPVVVHVVHNIFQPDENISEAQIHSQIEVLNEDFNLQNVDIVNLPNHFQGNEASVRIRFEMAQTDPNCEPTTGIIRIPTTIEGFNTNNNDIHFTSLGGSDAWPSDQYLNIWVCRTTNSLGRAFRPGGNPLTDGLVVGFEFFGRFPDNPFINNFNLGRTATHEAGHYFNLFHIFQDPGACGKKKEGDFVKDTPVQKNPNFECPDHPHWSCVSRDMFMNFMDYTNDNCMYMFTHGQKARMRATMGIGGPRYDLLNSPGRNPVPQIVLAYSNTTGTATIQWTHFGASPNRTGRTLQYEIQYRIVGTTTWSSHFAQAHSIASTITGLQAGETYEFRVKELVSCFSPVATLTLSNPPCTDGNEPNDNSSNATTIQANTTEYGLICPDTDQDWFRFTINSTQNNFRVLHNGSVLASNDYTIYNSALQTIPTNPVNNASAGTYYVKVEGPYSQNTTYSLRLETSENIYIEKLSDFYKDQSLLEIKIFPNPTKRLFSLEFKGIESEKNYNIQIYDLLGKVVYSSKHKIIPSTNIVSINMGENIKQGLYVVSISNSVSNEKRNYKLIIQK